jgi:signal transduction histidine kinase/integral membrane sensor domain MASE1
MIRAHGMPSRSVTLPAAGRDPLGRRRAALSATPAGRFWRDVAGVALLAALYYAAAKIGLRLAYLNGAVTALWPPVGVGIAALVLYGPRLWPGIVIGDLLVGDFSTPLGTVLGQTVGNTLEVLLAALLLRRLTRGRPAMDRVSDVFALVACAAVGTAISASFGTTSLRLGDVISPGEAGEVWRTWWLSDLSGAMVLTPLLLTWARTGLARLGRRELLEGVALLVVLVLLAELPSQRDVPYVVFPALIWAALRFGPRGAATALVVVSGLTVWNTAHNAGPFVRESITDSLLSSQLFLAAAALTSLVLAALTAERTRADAALRTNEQRLHSVVQSMAEGLVVRDADGRITDCNAAAEQILGLRRQDLRGRRPETALDGVLGGDGERDGDAGPTAPGRLLGDGTLESGAPEAGIVARVTRPDGQRRWVSISSAPVLDPAGVPEGVVTTLSDITERREAEQRLVESERATRTLASEQATLRRIATLVASEPAPASVFERVTAEVGRLLGVHSASVVRYDADRRATVVGTWTEPGVAGMTLGATVALDGDTVIARVHRSHRAERVESYEGAGGALAHRLRALGFRSSVAAPVSVGGRLWGTLVASTRQPEGLPADAERRLCDFAELVAQALANADARDKLAASRARIVEVGDAERQRLERNLHDGAQQRLVALALQLRLVEARMGPGSQAAREALAEARAQLDHGLAELRELARGIHPAVLTDRGLKPAVDSLADRVPVPIEVSDMPDFRLPEPVETAAYYLIAEAVTNVAKYARATHVAVSVRSVDGQLVVRISDDGVGGADPAAGSGLRGLSDRVEALHGRLRIDSPRGGGTRISAEIPIA